MRHWKFTWVFSGLKKVSLGNREISWGLSKVTWGLSVQGGVLGIVLAEAVFQSFKLCYCFGTFQINSFNGKINFCSQWFQRFEIFDLTVEIRIVGRKNSFTLFSFE